MRVRLLLLFAVPFALCGILGRLAGSAASGSHLQELNRRVVAELNDRYCEHCELGVGDCMKVPYYDALDAAQLLGWIFAVFLLGLAGSLWLLKSPDV